MHAAVSRVLAGARPETAIGVLAVVAAQAGVAHILGSKFLLMHLPQRGRAEEAHFVKDFSGHGTIGFH